MTETMHKASATNTSSTLLSHSSSEETSYMKWVIGGTVEASHKAISSGATRPRSNWETHLFDEVSQLIFQMTRLPVDHDFHLQIDVAQHAADILGIVNSNSQINAPKVINEEGDTVLFTWDEGDLKKYLCVDGDEVELRVRKPGTPYSTSEPMSHDGKLDISTLLNALGAGKKSGSVR